MSDPPAIDLFVEDRAHEEFLKPLVETIATSEGVAVRLRVRSARGGHARAVQEFEIYQKLVERGALVVEFPVLLIVAIDGNCSTFARKRVEIQGAAKPAFADRLVVACPDPHIERWYLADPDSFHDVVGHRPSLGTKKCDRDHYKNALLKAVRDGGHVPTLGGIELARELVEAMDLYRAGKNDHSLRAFVDDLRAKLRQIRPE